MARLRTRGGRGGSGPFTIRHDTFGVEATTRAFENLRGKEQRRAFRKAATKSVRRVRKTMKRLVPRGTGITPSGEKRPHLRDSLTINVKTLGRGRNRYVSGIVGADYKKVPTIHLVNNPVKAHEIRTVRKQVLSDQTSAGDDINVRAFGTRVIRPATPGLGFMEESARANIPAIKNEYIQAMGEAIRRSRERGRSR